MFLLIHTKGDEFTRSSSSGAIEFINSYSFCILTLLLKYNFVCVCFVDGKLTK